MSIIQNDEINGVLDVDKKIIKIKLKNNLHFFLQNLTFQRLEIISFGTKLSLRIAGEL